MFVQILNRIRRFLIKVKSSIAFYPTLVSLLIVVLGIFIMAIDNSAFATHLQEQFPLIIVKNIDTSRTILGSLIGALISLMVFSFSMVMVVLNQAANSFSPRLLPGLISDKKHQIVLGFYLGSIFHCIITLLRMEPADYDDYLPSLGVLFAIILGMICLALFIYFIHSISQSVQISKIVYSIYSETEKEIDKFQNQDELMYTKEPVADWQEVRFGIIGYIRDYDLVSLAEINKKHQFEIKTAHPEGAFISLNSPSFYVSKIISEKEKKLLKSCVIVDDEEWVGEHPNIGMKQLIEIILKAMSPGINDPGTALTALDYLTNLLRKRKSLRRYNCYKKQGGGRVFINSLSFEKLLKLSFAAIRQYVRHDVIIMQKLLFILHYLKQDEGRYEEQLFNAAIDKEAQTLMEDVNDFIENSSDREYLEELFVSYGFKAQAG